VFETEETLNCLQGWAPEQLKHERILPENDCRNYKLIGKMFNTRFYLHSTKL